MPEELKEPLSVAKAPPSPPPTVSYFRHLWDNAQEDAWAFVVEGKDVALFAAVFIFSVTTFLGFLQLGTDTLLEFVEVEGIAFAVVGISYGVLLLAHLCYFTPRELAAREQFQAERLKEEIGAKNAELAALKRLLATKTVEKNERRKQSVTD